MTGADFALMTLLSSQFGGFDNYVQQIKQERPEDSNLIEKVALLTEDMVIHYEKAIMVGTTEAYEERTKIWHLNSFLDAADNNCGEIDLATCIYDLVCENKISHNLATDMMPCK